MTQGAQVQIVRKKKMERSGISKIKITTIQQAIQELNQKIIRLQIEQAEKMEEKDEKIRELEKNYKKRKLNKIRI